MKNTIPDYKEDLLDPQGLYDGPSKPTDLWFLPDPDAYDDVVPGSLLKPFNQVPVLLRVADWHAAEASLVADLAALEFDCGRLAERVSCGRQAAIQRLALAEAVSLSWWTGDRISPDRLALWQSYRIGATEEDGGGLIRTAWVARRLITQAGSIGDTATAITTFLGEDSAPSELITDVARVLEAVAGLSPIVRGCALFHLWRSLDERPDHLRRLEAFVLGVKMAAGQRTPAEGGLPFLPVSMTGLSSLATTGTTEQCLSGWIKAAHQAVLSALMRLGRLAAWTRRATASTSDLSGRTPAMLIAALAAHPVLAIPQAKAATGASRAALQRNLDVLTKRGLVREITGHGRFRVWAATE